MWGKPPYTPPYSEHSYPATYLIVESVLRNSEASCSEMIFVVEKQRVKSCG